MLVLKVEISGRECVKSNLCQRSGAKQTNGCGIEASVGANGQAFRKKKKSQSGAEGEKTKKGGAGGGRKGGSKQ